MSARGCRSLLAAVRAATHFFTSVLGHPTHRALNRTGLGKSSCAISSYTVDFDNPVLAMTLGNRKRSLICPPILLTVKAGKFLLKKVFAINVSP
jgi:hypothetical protein